MLIIRDLLEGKSMFNELKQSLGGISANILSERLRSLESDQIITCRLYSEHPPRYEYKLTEAGQQLCHVLNAMTVWGHRHLNKSYTKLTHSACDHEVQFAYYCSHCEKLAEELSKEAVDHE